MTASLAGCSSLFFYPMKPWVQNPARLGLAYEDVVLIHRDGTRIDGWWLPAAGTPKGTVYYLHGNAQNISTHIMNVAWLPAAGYQVLLIDYQGFGMSDGTPSIQGALDDVQLGLNWLTDSGRLAGKPLVVYGQSLGASLSLWVMAQPQNKSRVACVIEEAAFADYRDIVNDVMKKSWLLWPLRPLMVPFIDDRYAPIKEVKSIAPVPLLIMHSNTDAVVPFAHGERLFAAAGQPKRWLPITGMHAQGPKQESVRAALLDFMHGCGASKVAPQNWSF